MLKRFLQTTVVCAVLWVPLCSVVAHAEDTTFTNTTIAAEDFIVRGQLSKSSGTFLIDHPLDPVNKLLYHSFVESPEMRDFYDGIAELDENGEVAVQLPGYFRALNESLRFQVKPAHDPQPNLFVRGVHDNTLLIAGGAPFAKVSWQVTGRRHDPYAVANRITTEVGKGPNTLVSKGEYFYEGNRPRIEWLLPGFLRGVFVRG